MLPITMLYRPLTFIIIQDFGKGRQGYLSPPTSALSPWQPSSTSSASIMPASAVSPLSWRGRSFLNQAYDPAQSFAYTSAYFGVRAESTAETPGTPGDTGPTVNTPRSNHYFNIFSRWLFNNDCTCSSSLNLSYLLGLVS